MKKSNIKTIVRLALIVMSLLGMIACAMCQIVFYFQNPDMTELRRIIEFPWPTIGLVICLAVFGIGLFVVKD